MTGSAVEFWFEFASTYSYVAAARIESEARRCGIGVDWHPFLLGSIFSAQGCSDSPFNLYPRRSLHVARYGAAVRQVQPSVQAPKPVSSKWVARRARGESRRD